MIEDMVNIGAYSAGSNPEIDRAIAMNERIEMFLRQDVADSQPLDVSFEKLHELAGQAQ